MDDVNVFAMYLPQYHETKENNQFWGQGFTDWVSVRKAVPLFDGHIQPKSPANNNYYDLSIKKNIEWQAQLAKKYGVSGLGVYHYWFSSEHRTLTKPAEIILENKDIDISYFLAWDNASWKRTWSKIKGNDWSPLVDGSEQMTKGGPEILIEYKLGTKEDWKIHFEYLLPYFMDGRYVKDGNKPIFLIYNYSREILDMCMYWDELALQSGLDGIEVIFSYNPFHGIPKKVMKFRYEPLYSGWGKYTDRFLRLINRNKVQQEVAKYSYDKVWEQIINSAERCRDKNTFYGGFVNYDDTPRRGNKGKAILGSSPEKFSHYLSQLIKVCEAQNKKYIFLTAWNEWGEGAYLEPDDDDGYAYLEAFKKARGLC